MSGPLRLDVVIVRTLTGRRSTELFVVRLARERPQALFVDPLAGLMRRGDIVVKTNGRVCRCALSLASGAMISLDQMADWEFADRVDGGPESARNQMRFVMIKARAALSALGYLTASEYDRGYSARVLPIAS